MPETKPPQENPGNAKPRSRNYMIYFAVALFLGSGIYFIFREDIQGLKEITWQDFVSRDLLTHQAEQLEVVNNEQVIVYLKSDPATHKPLAQPFPAEYFRIGSVDSFEKKLEEAQNGFTPAQMVTVRYVKRSNWFTEGFSWLIPVLLFLFFWRYLLSSPSSQSNSVFSFSRSKATPMVRKKGAPTFKDVAGYEEAKVEVMEVVEFLKQPENFTRLGAKIPKGVLLIGPPGTGKTLLARAVAGEANVPFYSLAGSEFVEMFVGVGASRVRDLFRNAKASAPCIIFIDELDTVGRTRERAASLRYNDERESTLNQLLAEMDGFDSDSRIIVLAATNRADILDPALTRAGRFDRHIYLELPDKKERAAIFGIHLSRLKYNNATVDPQGLSDQTPGFSGADIANVCNEAALIAARQKREQIELNDFNEAIEKITGGLEKKSAIISDKEKNIVAFHEAGHAVVSWMIPDIDPIIKLSIIPRGRSLGSTRYLPHERHIVTKAELEAEICAALGGRAAEQLIFGQLSSGAADDLERATKTAYMMVANLGFDEKLGNISYNDSTGAGMNSLYKPFSEATGRMIDTGVHDILEKAYEKAEGLLKKNKDKLEQLAGALNKKETLEKEEIEAILGKKDQLRPEKVREYA